MKNFRVFYQALEIEGPLFVAQVVMVFDFEGDPESQVKFAKVLRTEGRLFD